VIMGVNRVYEHGGREFHVQAEDLGLDQKCFEVRVYDRGTVLWHKRVPYGDIVDQGLSKGDFEEALRALVERTLHTVHAAIAKGKIGS
jgi:hypothetical protein